MGNENSKSNELTKLEKSPENQENGSVKGISVNFTSKGLEIDANGEADVQENGGPPSVNLSTESNDPGFVVVETDCQQGDAPVISEILEANVQEGEVKKSKDEKSPLFGKIFKKKTESPAEVKSAEEPETPDKDQTDVSVPASDPEPESGSSGEEAAAMIIAEHVEDSLCQKVEVSTQTDGKSEADISTQTGADDDDVIADSESRFGEETVTGDHSLSGSAVVVVEDAIKETADEEPLDNQTAGFFIEDVVTFENDVHKNITFRAEPVEVTAMYEEESMSESELEVAEEADPNKPMEGESVAEERDVEKAMPLEVYLSLPKVVADCVVAVFADVSESADFIPVDTSKPTGDEVITEDHRKEAKGMVADIALMEAPEPQSNAANVFANMVFRAERMMEVTEINHVRNYHKESMNETEPEATAGSNPNKSVSGGEIAAEENNVEENVTLENYSSLPKVVADCVEAVFAGVCESSEFSSEPSLDEGITEDNGETSEPETNGVTPEAEEGNGVPPLDEEPPSTATETISEVVCDEPNPSCANRDVPVEERSVPVVVAETAVKVESAHEVVTADGAAAAENDPGISEEFIIIEVPPNGNSPNIEVIPESCADVMADVEEAEPSPLVVIDDADVEIAIDVLSQEFSAVARQEPEADAVLEEEVTAAKTFVALSGEKEAEPTIPEEPRTVETNEEAVWTSKGIEAVRGNKKADTLQRDATRESEPSVKEKPGEQNVTPADVPVEGAVGDAASVVAVEEQDGFSAVSSEEPVGPSTSLQEPLVPLIILQVTECGVRRKITHDREGSQDVLGAVVKSSEVSQSATWEETVVKCVDAEITPEECDLMTFEEVTPEVIVESEPRASVQEEVIEDEQTGFLETQVPGVMAEVTDEEETINEKVNSAHVLATVEKNSKDSPNDTSDEPKEKCVEAVLATVAGEVRTVDDAPECNLVTSEEVVPGIPADTEPCVSVQEEVKEENVTPADLVVRDVDREAAAPSVVAVKEPTGSSPVTAEEGVEGSASAVEPKKQELTLPAAGNAAKGATMNGKAKSDDALAAVGENSEESQTNTSEGPVVKCVEGDLETSADGAPEVTADGAPEVTAGGDTDSHVNSTDSTQSVATTEEADVTCADTDDLLDTADPKQESVSLAEPASVTPEPEPQGKAPEESDNGDSPREESVPEENPVMNFFKTLVTPTKTAKKETATPVATEVQSEKEKPPAATITVAQVSEPPAAPKGMNVPPPPPPEPPKPAITAEPAAKPAAKPTLKEEPKAAVKEPETSKAKSAKVTLHKFFRPKKMKEEPQPAVEVEVQPVVEVQEAPVEEPVPVLEVQSEQSAEAQETAEEAQPVVEEQLVEEEPQPVVEDEKVDPSKTGTLEATPKPEPPPPVQEEKKTSSKSAFLSLFKPKAADPNKASPVPAAAAEAAHTAKAKEEPKAAAKSPELVASNKPASEASQAGNDAGNTPKKLEKRNSVQKFFKNLGQRRSSTEAGVQTEPVTTAPGAEKAK